MGATSGKVYVREIDSFGQVVRLSGKSEFPPEVQYAHYTPSTFPLRPQLKPEYMPLCRKTWQVIVKQREKHPEYGSDIHGITLFYNEFYERLAKVDTKGLYENILVMHAVGTNRIAAKGAILMRIVDFLLRLDGDTPASRESLTTVGRAHTSKGIRPWQYSVFLELFVLTLGSRLQKYATPSVMEAWVNLLGFSLKYMLPQAIEGLVLDTEAHVNFVLSEEDIDVMLKEGTTPAVTLIASDTSNASTVVASGSGI